MSKSKPQPIHCQSGDCIGYIRPHDDEHYVVLDRNFNWLAEFSSMRNAERFLRDLYFRTKGRN